MTPSGLPSTQAEALAVTSLPVGSARDAFNAAYVNHWPPPIRALLALQDVGQRAPIIAELGAQKISIDVPIWRDGGDPCWTMLERMANGYLPWWPGSLSPLVEVAPGVPVPAGSGLVAYDPSVPAVGSFLTSLNIADFEAFSVPAPQPAPPAVSVVGAAYPGTVNLFMTTPATPAWLSLGNGSGSIYTDPASGKRYQYFQGSAFSPSYFELVG